MKSHIFRTQNVIDGMKIDADAEDRVLRYLKEGSEEFYEINLMLIGQSGVGKTTIAKGLLGDLDPKIPLDKTNGIDVHLHRCQYNRHTRQIFPVVKGMNNKQLILQSEKLDPI